MRRGEETREKPPRDPQPAALGSINARYGLVEELGKGGMGAVFLAVDRHRGGRRVALKRVRGDRVDAGILATLRNEFLSLASLFHPNVTRVFDFGVDQSTRDIFFTSEFVEGIDWLKFTRMLDLSSAEGLEAFLETIIQVLRGLEFIHAQGLVHLDMKPENVLITRHQDGESSSAKIIDFGLAKREKDFGGKKIMGTTYYIAPETILGARVDRRTDLYSLGVVLYQLVTQTLPFRGKSNLEVFKGHLERTPAPPHEVVPAIPRQLSTIILCLMEKKPDDRFQTALEVVDEINRELGFSFPLEDEVTLASYLESARGAGREEELEKLHAIFGQVSKTEPLGIEAEGDADTLEIERGLLAGRDIAPPVIPSGRLVLLRGEKGLGKRRTVEKLGYLARTRGAAVLEVECGGASGRQTDFLLFVRELVGYAAQSENGTFAEDAVSLARRLKGEIAGDLDAPGIEALRKIAQGLVETGRKHPFLLHFHDLHLAGSALIAAVECLVEAAAAERVIHARHLLTATTLDQADTEETPLQHLYQSPAFRHAVLDMRFERLDGENVARTIAAAFPGAEFAEALARDVLEESDGNTDAVLDILQFFLQKGIIRRTPGGWAFSAAYRRDAVPGRVRTELARRIEGLPRHALELAVAFACLGDGGELDIAVRMARLEEAAGEEAIRILRREKLVQERVLGDPQRIFTFVHSTAQALLYERIPESDRPEEHRRAGSLYEEHYRARGGEDPKKLAYHFLRAGDMEKGVSYGIRAGEAFVREHQPLPAIVTYERVLELLAPSDRELSLRLRRRVADLRFETGEYREAIAVLEPLVSGDELAGDLAARCRIYLSIARAQGQLGQYREAATITQEVVRWQEEAEALAPVLSELLLICAELHSSKGNLVESLRCCERLLGMRGKLDDPEALGRLYLVLAENHFRLNNQTMAATYCQEALKLIDSQAQTRSPDFNLFCLAKYYKYKGKLLKAAKQFELSAQVSRKLGASDRRADALLEVGTVHQWLERPRLALPALEQAAALYRRSGNAPQSIEALSALGETRRLAGAYQEARECLGEAFKKAEDLKNRQAKTQALLSYAGLCLDAGDLENAERYLSEADAKDVRVSGYTAQRMLELRFTLALHHGAIDQALEQAAKGLGTTSQGDNRIVSAKLLAQRAMLLCRLGKKMDARRALVMLLEIGKTYSFPLCEGRARLLEGLVLAAEGKAGMAAGCFSQAAEIFRREGCERELTQLYLEHGVLNLKHGDLEQAYLNLEEGFYLAKKLNLTYMKCQYYFAMGLLELVIPGGEPARAEDRLRYAERLAAQSSYEEILWKIQYYLGKVYEWKGRREESEAYLTKSLAGRRKTTDSIPLMYRHGYLKSAADEALESLLDDHMSEKAPASSNA